MAIVLVMVIAVVALVVAVIRIGFRRGTGDR